MSPTHRIIGALSRLFSNAATVGGRQERATALDTYVHSAPTPKNAVDIFKGAWASDLAPPFSGLTDGVAPLYKDPRLLMGLEMVGGVAGKRVLELGPLEGGHTYLMDRAGAADVFAVEGNTQAFLKCLVAKELLGIRSARFVCGDFVEYLRGTPEPVDLVVASGVLYHMMNPVELIARVARIADTVYMWTHYYDETQLAERWQAGSRIGAQEQTNFEGFPHTLYPYDYGRAVGSSQFCGGSHSQARWLTRDGILGALAHFGFTRIEPFYEQPDHPHGPAFCVVAQR